MTRNVLYISYDGMTDPLGQSQVIPYIVGLQQKGHRFTLLSCEKKERFEKYGADIRQYLQSHDIDWQPIFYTASPPILAKYWDIFQLRRKASQLHKTQQFDMTHCRSYVSADVGLYLKRKFGVKFLFDMRGFWVDERVDGGLWNLDKAFYRFAYKQYKKKEADYLENSDAVVILTEAGKQEMMTWESYNPKVPIQVIPCSADFEVFPLVNAERREAARKDLDIGGDRMVVAYLGSIGTWYMLEEMLLFFSLLKKMRSDALFLFVTPEKPETIFEAATKYDLTPEDFKITFAKRHEVGHFLSAADFSVFFIKPLYSKISSSPTKLGELLAMGIPVVCNTGVGDVGQIIDDSGGGVAIDDFEVATLEGAAKQILEELEGKKYDVAAIRERAFAYYDLAKAVEKYAGLYGRI